MSDERLRLRPELEGILRSEEAIYGLILVSGMIVVSYGLVGTSINAFITVVVTVVVFFAAHVFSGTLARLAASDGAAGVWPSVRASVQHSSGMLLAALPPLVVLLLGTARLIPDDTAIWAALLLDVALLAVLGWLIVARWTTRFWPRLLSAVITAAFGRVLVALKAFIHH